MKQNKLNLSFQWLSCIIMLLSLACQTDALEVENPLIRGHLKIFSDRSEIEQETHSNFRMLQTPEKMYTSMFSVITDFEYYGNEIIFDSVTNRIFTVVPDNGQMMLMTYSYMADNQVSQVKFTVHSHACGIKSGGGPVKSMAYNLIFTPSNTPATNGDRLFATFHYNSVNNTPFPKMDCNLDEGGLSLISYTDGAPAGSFSIVKSWGNLFTTKTASLKTLICDNTCNFYQPRASVWVSSSKKIAGLFLFTVQSGDLSPTNGTPPAKKGFVLATFTADPSSAAVPFHKVFGYEDALSSGLMNVRKIYNIPNTDIVYFLVQEGQNIYLVTINISTANDTLKNQGNKILLVNDALQETQYGIDYDSVTSRFILVYVSAIDLQNNSRTNAFFFKLTPDYAGIPPPDAFKLPNAYVPRIPGPPANTNSIKYVKFVSDFIFLCDFYHCASIKLNNNTFTTWTTISTTRRLGGVAKLSSVVMNSDNTNLYLWYSGYDIDGPNSALFIGNSMPIRDLCFFYKRSDNTKCQAKCEDSYTAVDSSKLCIETTCAANKRFYLNFICSSHCSDYNAVYILNNRNFCMNTPCPANTLYRDVTVSYNQLYHECDAKCPGNLYWEPPNSTCSQTCLSNLYEASTGPAANKCMASCSSGYADKRFGTSGPPFRCLSESKCPVGSLIVKSGEIPGLQANLCFSSCPTGFYLDYTGTYCLVCRSTEGRLWQNICIAACPTYTVVNSTTNACTNCKDSNQKWYEGLCVSTVPTTSVLVDATYNAYKKCQDADKKIYKTSCVDSCPAGSYPYNLKTYQCYEAITDSKYVFNNTIVDSCPRIYGPDNFRSCVKCYGIGNGQYEYNRTCVTACPSKYYYDSDNVCISCTTIGDINDPVYKSNCVVPTCPSNALTDYDNRKCIYCKDSNTYMLNGACVASCPPNSEINFETYECTYCRKYSDNYYYKNKCFSNCPAGTSPTDYFTCVDDVPSCSPNPCQNGGACKMVNNEPQCECPTTTEVKYVGQFCRSSQNYVDSFFAGHLSTIASLESNYTSFSNINKVVTELKTETINNLLSNLEFIETNYPDFNTQFATIADKVLTMTSKYLSVLQKGSYYPSYDIYNIYNSLLKMSGKVIERNLFDNTSTNGNDTNSINKTVRNMGEISPIQTVVDSVKSQIVSLTNIFTQLNTQLSYPNEKTLNFTDYNLNFYYSSDTSYQSMTNYLMKTDQSFVDFSDCVFYLRYSNTYQAGYYALNSITWTSALTLPTSGDNPNLTKVINFNVYSPSTYGRIAFAKECGLYNGKKPIFIRYKLDLGQKLNKTFNDYFYVRNINIYDSNSKFYNDRCYIFSSDDGYDVSLAYRKKYISPNTTVDCGDGCNYIGIDFYDYTVCQCTDMGDSNSFSVKVVDSSFTGVNGNNLQLIQCTPNVFNKNFSLKNIQTVLLNNVGFWFGIGIVAMTILMILIKNIFLWSFLNIKNKNRELNYVNKIAYYDAHFYSPSVSPFADFKKLHNEGKRYLSESDYAKVSYSQIPRRKIDFLKLAVGAPKDMKNKDASQADNDAKPAAINIELNQFPKKEEEKKEDENEKMLGRNNYIDLDSLYKKRKKDKSHIINKYDEDKYVEFNPFTEVNLSLQDCLSLNHQEILMFDKRSYSSYYYDWLIQYNNFFHAFFCHSIIYPSHIRILLFFLNVSLEFTLNAMLFSDDYLDMMYMKKNKNFDFIFQYQLEINVISIVLSKIPIILLRFLYAPDHKTRRKFNEYLISKKLDLIVLSYGHFYNAMKINYFVIYLISLLFFGWGWFYGTLFCGIYINSSIMWLYGGIVTVLLDIVVMQSIILPLFYIFIRCLGRTKCRACQFFYRIIRN